MDPQEETNTDQQEDKFSKYTVVEQSKKDEQYIVLSEHLLIKCHEGLSS